MQKCTIIKVLFIFVPLILSKNFIFAEDDLASKRLLEIATKENQIYKQIAEDPLYYSATDLDRRINELVASYRSYLADNPKDVGALILYGKLLRRLEQNEESFKVFLKADELDPHIAVVKQQIGTHLAEEGKGKAALTFYLMAIDLEPDKAAYHFGLGHLLHTYKDDFIEENIFSRDAIDREMQKAFQKAASLAPDDFNIQMRLGEAYYDLASPDWKTALMHWQKMRQDTEDTFKIQMLDLHIAHTMAKLGRYEEARDLANTVTEELLESSKLRVLSEIAQH